MEFGLKGEILVETAARGALQILLQNINPRNKKIVLYAGGGNNGADCFALARMLSSYTDEMLVLHSTDLENYKNEAKFHLQFLKKLKITLQHIDNIQINFLPEIIVDGLIGTGLKGILRPNYEKYIKNINQYAKSAFIFSLDIPSGLDGKTGLPCPIAVKANTTVCFEHAKTGIFCGEGIHFTGNITKTEIGIFEHIKKQFPTKTVLLKNKILHTINKSATNSYKNANGHVLIIGGSTGLSGAPYLSALGALRSGAGLVSIACPRKIEPIITSFAPEIMTIPLGDSEILDEKCFEKLEPILSKFSAIVLGPGLGRNPKTEKFILKYTKNPHPNTIYDADALYFLAHNFKLLSYLPPTSIFTPHAGEAAAFFPNILKNSHIFASNPLNFITKFTELHAGIWVLKGAPSLIAQYKKQTALCPIIANTLATAGSGDILSGIIASLVALKNETLHSAWAGVYWHAKAGLKLKEKYPERGNFSSELANILPFVFGE